MNILNSFLFFMQAFPVMDDTGGIFSMYIYLFIAAFLMIAIISVFVILGIHKAHKENQELSKMQQEQLSLIKESVELLKQIKENTLPSKDKQSE